MAGRAFGKGREKLSSSREARVMHTKSVDKMSPTSFSTGAPLVGGKAKPLCSAARTGISRGRKGAYSDADDAGGKTVRLTSATSTFLR